MSRTKAPKCVTPSGRHPKWSNDWALVGGCQVCEVICHVS